MNKRIIILFFIVVLVIGSVIWAVFNTANKAPQKEDNIIGMGKDQKPDILEDPDQDSVILLNPNQLYYSLTSDQFQNFKTILAYYVHANLSANISEVEVLNNTVKVEGTTVSAIVKPSGSYPPLNVKIVPTSYYYTDVFINGVKAPYPAEKDEAN